MRHLFFSLALLVPLSASAGGDAETLRNLLEEFLAGASANDAGMHDRFWAEDLVYTSSDGERFGKAEIMAGLEESADSPEPSEGIAPTYSARDVNIRSYGETAIVTFRLVAEREGQSTTEYFNTGVFRSREGQWRAVAWQATRIGIGDDER